MAWQNIYDLGDVDLYVSLDGGALTPLADADLGGGTIAEVGGVLQLRNMPSTNSNAFQLVARPRFTRTAAVAMRLTTGSVVMPQDNEFADFLVASGVLPEDAPVDLDAVIVDGVCTSFSNTQPIAIGSMIVDQGTDEAPTGVTFSFVENES